MFYSSKLTVGGWRRWTKMTRFPVLINYFRNLCLILHFHKIKFGPKLNLNEFVKAQIDPWLIHLLLDDLDKGDKKFWAFRYYYFQYFFIYFGDHKFWCPTTLLHKNIVYWKLLVIVYKFPVYCYASQLSRYFFNKL